MKHQEHIVAVNNSALVKHGLTGDDQQLYQLDIGQLMPELLADVVVEQRAGLEKDESKRQLILYLLFQQMTAEGAKFFAYRRGKGVGESRLAGNVSVGVGGHVDGPDVVYSESGVMDVLNTVLHAAAREIKEEILFNDADYEVAIGSVGVLLDNTDEVGKVHMGLVLRALLPEGAQMQCAEEELETLGFFTATELLNSGLPLENWTRTLLESAVEAEEA
jgi:predicted NUDIX family phosphoesterase